MRKPFPFLTTTAALALLEKDGSTYWMCGDFRTWSEAYDRCLQLGAQLITTEPEMAESLASIVRGLISLQVFNDDMDPEVSYFLQNTNVNLDANKLTVSFALDPEAVVAAIE